LAIAPNAHFLDADFLVEYDGRLPSSGNTESINALRNLVCPHTTYFAPYGPSETNALVLPPSSVLGGYDTIYSCIVAAFSMPDDTVSFFSNYDESISFSEHTDEPDSFDAFHTAECPSPPTICPLDDTTPNPLMLLPASVLLGDVLILGSDQLVDLGFSAAINSNPTLTDPTGSTHSLLPLFKRRPSIPLQLIPHANGPFLGLGYPDGSGAPIPFLLDTCATRSIITRDLAHILRAPSPGTRLIFGGSVTIASLGSGLLPLRCFRGPIAEPTPSPAPKRPRPSDSPDITQPTPAPEIPPTRTNA
jgi:hypothetical protein